MAAVKRPWDRNVNDDELVFDQEYLPLRPLVPNESPDPFPVGLLPAGIRAAVQEVIDVTQAPDALAATCALGVVSSIAQGLVDVARDPVLVGPTSLNTLAIAVSGERKTTVDNLLLRGMRRWQAEATEALKVEVQRHQGHMEAWAAQEAGIKDALKKAARDGEQRAVERLAQELTEHTMKRPRAPLVPKLLRQDDTPERLIHALNEWPMASIISSEAGIIFGSHGMSDQVVMRNLAQANTLWDGGTVERGRVGTGDVSVSGVRVSMSLQLQPAVFKAFFEKSGGLARGIGYFARFLVCEPESTQGERFYAEPPATGLPGLEQFERRAYELLNLVTTRVVQAAGKLELDRICLNDDPEVKKLWRGYFDSVEEELGKGRDYYDIQDVAAKSAEQAARIWANLVVWEKATTPEARHALMLSAVEIARYYLNEFLRFSRTSAVPAVLQRALELEAWICTRCAKHELPFEFMKAISQYGPNATRLKPARDEAISVLVDHGRAVTGRFGKVTQVVMPLGSVLREYGFRPKNG